MPKSTETAIQRAMTRAIEAAAEQAVCEAAKRIDAELEALRVAVRVYRLAGTPRHLEDLQEFNGRVWEKLTWLETAVTATRAENFELLTRVERLERAVSGQSPSPHDVAIGGPGLLMVFDQPETRS